MIRSDSWVLYLWDIFICILYFWETISFIIVNNLYLGSDKLGRRSYLISGIGIVEIFLNLIRAKAYRSVFSSKVLKDNIAKYLRLNLWIDLAPIIPIELISKKLILIACIILLLKSRQLIRAADTLGRFSYHVYHFLNTRLV